MYPCTGCATTPPVAVVQKPILTPFMSPVPKIIIPKLHNKLSTTFREWRQSADKHKMTALFAEVINFHLPIIRADFAFSSVIVWSCHINNTFRSDHRCYLLRITRKWNYKSRTAHISTKRIDDDMLDNTATFVSITIWLSVRPPQVCILLK